MNLQLEINIVDDRWIDLGFADIAQVAVESTLSRIGISTESCEIGFLACDDRKITDLNGAFRDKPTPTNVLSWPDADLGAEADGQPPDAPEADQDGMLCLGDVAIAYDTCKIEAESAKIPMADHVSHLIVHGVLHLLGYDHIRDGDAALMEGLEIEILGTLGITNPYRANQG